MGMKASIIAAIFMALCAVSFAVYAAYDGTTPMGGATGDQGTGISPMNGGYGAGNMMGNHREGWGNRHEGNRHEGMGNHREGWGNHREGWGNHREGMGNRHEGMGNHRDGDRDGMGNTGNYRRHEMREGEGGIGGEGATY
jgi:hypothetical protein